MFDLKTEIKPKIVALVPIFVLLAACSSKQIQNASLEPLDLPTEESDYSYQTPEPEMSAPVVPARVSKSKKKSSSRKALVARNGKKKSKKKASATALARVEPKIEQGPTMPAIGESTLANAQIEMPMMAPPIPMDPVLEAPAQPNWMLAAFMIGGIVALGGLVFRIRRNQGRKRGLVFN